MSDQQLSVSNDEAPCVLHKAHRPITIINELHHVFPQYMQKEVWGEVRDNTRVSICSTSHNSVHYAITYYLKNARWPDNVVGATRDLAEKAVAAYQAAKASA